MIGNYNTVQIEKVGSLELTTMIDGINRTVSVSNVAYVPELTTNLFQVSQLQQKNVEVYFKMNQNRNGIAEVVNKSTGPTVMKGIKGS